MKELIPEISTMLAVLFGLVLLLLLRTATLLYAIRKGRERQDDGILLGSKKKNANTTTTMRPQNTLVVLGSGGHTTEMLHLIRHLDPKRYKISLIVATTDTTSLRRVQAYPHPLPFDKHSVKTYCIPRSREVGQSYLTSIATTLYSFWFAMYLVGFAALQPDLVLVNGPGTCLPIAMSSFLYRVIGWNTNSRVVFCESFCRVTSLSLTGRLLYHVADLFCVCWEELAWKYPRTQLVSTFVRPTTTSQTVKDRISADDDKSK